MSNCKNNDFEKALKIIIKSITDQSDISKLMKPEFYCCNIDDMSLTVAFEIYPSEINVNGYMHGVYIFSAFDSVCGMVTHFFAKEHFITTVESSIRYLKPVELNDKMLVKAKIVDINDKIVTLTAEASIKKGTVICATYNSVFMILENIKSKVEFK